MKKASILASLALFLTLATPALAHPGHTEHEQLGVVTTTPEEDEALKEVNDELIEISTPSGEVTDEESPINYTLPYPGMLPDHPLYFLKTARDAIIGVLISDSLKKAEFNLLNSDKQVASAIALAENDKDEKATNSISNAQNYLTLSISELEKAKTQKKDYAALRDRINSAIQKHQEVVENLQNNINNSEELSSYEAYLQKAQLEISQIK